MGRVTRAMAAWITRRFDVSIEYAEREDERPLAQQVAGAVKRLIADGLDGDVLVFLPGAAEIHQAMRACAPIAERWGLVVLPLHGDLPAEEQDRAVAPADRRKVILSTNVAESSVTIDGVKAVIDSGLSRVAGYSAWSGLPVLRLKRVSRASAEQRAGRAGRTAPGRVIRLYSAEDFHRRPAHETPDVLRRELTATCLDLHAMGLGRVDDLEWLDPPPAESIRAAEDLLARLGAVDRRGLTETGRRMAGYPLPPRLSRIVIEAETHGTMEDGCAIAALLSAGARAPEQPASTGPSDLFALLESDWPAEFWGDASSVPEAAVGEGEPAGVGSPAVVGAGVWLAQPAISMLVRMMISAMSNPSTIANGTKLATGVSKLCK